MKKCTIILLIILPFWFFPQQSIIEEHVNYYKPFQFTHNNQWDSLRSIGNNINTSAEVNTLKTNTTFCSLTKKVFGWHPYWVGSAYLNYDWSMLSDFCYFHYTIDPATGNNTNVSFDWLASPAVTAAKTNSVNIHFGATLFSNHSTFWANPSAQQTFITNAINLLNTRGGNGLNVDFEVMVAADRVPFTNFMVNLCNQVHAANANYKVSLDIFSTDFHSVFDIATLNGVVDDFIIMGYDYYYGTSPKAGPVSPLYNFETAVNYTLPKSVTYYLKQGVAKQKLLLGLPYYGREWETTTSTIPSATTSNFTGSRTYAYIKNNSTIYSSTNKKWDQNSFNPYYVYQTGGNWRQCWIDDPYSMSRKFDMVNQRGIAGIGIWALGYDDGYQDYWQLIKNKFSNCAIVACTDSIFDMGGPNRNYYNDESYAFTIAPNGANTISLTFGQFNLESGHDSLYVFNGYSTAAPLLGAYSSTIIPNVINSTAPALTLKFKSDVGVNKPGFKAVWNCAPLATTIEETHIEYDLNIYPNPSKSNITVRYLSPNNENVEYKLLDVFGKTITRGSYNVIKGLNLFEIDITSLNINAGLYFVNLNTSKNKVSKKIIIE